MTKLVTNIPKQLQKDNFRFCFVNFKIPFPTGWQKEENAYKYNEPKLLEQIKKGNYGVVGGIGDIMIVDADNKKIDDAFSIFGDTFTGKTGNGTHLYYLVPELNKSYALAQETTESTPENLQFENIGHITSRGRMVVAPGCKHYEQIDAKNFKPTGKTYEVIKDVEIRTITKEQVLDTIKPFRADIIRESYQKQEEAQKTDNTNVIDIDISLIAEKMKDLKKASPGYRGHNPDHRQSKSRMDLSIDTKKNWWVCSACCNNGYGYGNALYLIALNEGILHCHECKKGGLRGKNFLAVKKLAIDKYGVSPAVFPVIKKKALPPLKQEKLDEYKVFYVDAKGNEKISCPKLAKLIMFDDGNHFIVLNDNLDIFVYNGSYYEPMGKGIIENRVSYYLDERTCKRYKQEVVSFIQNYEYVDRNALNPDVNLINLKNGVYNRETNKLIPHTPEIYFLNELPVNYNPKAKINKIKKFFNDLLNVEDITILQEFFGDCLQRTYKYKKAMMCVGITNTGKSRLLELLGSFLGENNTSNVSLYQLCTDKFATIELYGRFANICADIGATGLKFTELFKTVTGGDRLRGQKKHKDSFEFKNHAKLIYSCNQIPYSDDQTDAYYGRWLVIEFSNQFDEETRKPDILKDITTENEMSGLFNWAIEGLQRLEKNKGYSEHRSLEDVKEFMLKGSNPISEFAVTYIELDRNNVITKADLYQAYVEFCKMHNYPSKDDNVFSRKIKPELPHGWDDGQSRKKKAKRVWKGIKCTFFDKNTSKKVNTTLIEVGRVTTEGATDV